MVRLLFRVKDLKFLEVFNSKGKKLGEVEDIAIDYFEARVIGFLIAKTLFKKKNFIDIKNIISFGEKIVINELEAYNGISYDDIKNLDIVNKKGEMIGVLEDIVVDNTFNIKGLIISKGFFEKFIKGKHLILLKETILGEQNILFFGNDNINFNSIPHNLWRG